MDGCCLTFEFVVCIRTVVNHKLNINNRTMHRLKVTFVLCVCVWKWKKCVCVWRIFLFYFFIAEIIFTIAFFCAQSRNGCLLQRNLKNMLHVINHYNRFFSRIYLVTETYTVHTHKILLISIFL